MDLVSISEVVTVNIVDVSVLPTELLPGRSNLHGNSSEPEI